MRFCVKRCEIMDMDYTGKGGKTKGQETVTEKK